MERRRWTTVREGERRREAGKNLWKSFGNIDGWGGFIEFDGMKEWRGRKDRAASLQEGDVAALHRVLEVLGGMARYQCTKEAASMTIHNDDACTRGGLDEVNAIRPEYVNVSERSEEKGSGPDALEYNELSFMEAVVNLGAGIAAIEPNHGAGHDPTHGEFQHHVGIVKHSPD
jgi:hypothetical protein